MTEPVFSVVAYRDTTGRQPFERWLDTLDARAAAKVIGVLARIAEGNLSGVTSVGGGVLERRIHAGPGYRLYFGRDGARLIVLLAGGTKRRQQQDIDLARARWSDYVRRRTVKGQSQ